MGIEVYYNGSKIIDESSDCVKKLNTQGMYMEDDVTIQHNAIISWNKSAHIGDK